MARQSAWTSKNDAWETRAMVILTREARRMPQFSAGLAAVERAVREAHAEFVRIKGEGGNPIEYMRSRGGWPKIADEAFRASVGDTAAAGSQRISPIRLAGQMQVADWQPIVQRVIAEWQDAR